MALHLIAGLGNPGPQYEASRHNVGFRVVDLLAERWSAGPLREKFKGHFCKASRPTGADVLLLKPMTYMNLSGESVQKAQAYYQVEAEHTVVVHDELDLPFGELRIKVGGGAAGHNGIRSVTQQTGENGFVRLRFGIGRPRGTSGESPSGRSFVLGDFDTSERAELPELLERAADMVEAVVDAGPREAMNRFHGQDKGRAKG